MNNTLPSHGQPTGALSDALTVWARGWLPDESAVMLLVHSGMLGKVAHLARTDDAGRTSFDWAEVVAWFDTDGGVLSGGERRIIAGALSLAEARPVNLGDVLAGVDRTNARHVLAACAHAAGLDLPAVDGRPAGCDQGQHARCAAAAGACACACHVFDRAGAES